MKLTFLDSPLKKFFFIFTSYQFFFSLLLWVPIFYEYQKRIGLNDGEIFRIQSLYYIVFCLLEIPTGFLADKIGYKVCLILGSFTLFLANIWVPIDASYQGFLIHFILIALARSFVSGASSAYLYEALHQKNLLNEYKEAEGRARFYSLIGKVVCWASIGLIMQWHLTLPYWLTALNALLSLYFAYKLPNISATQSENKISILKIFPLLYNNFYLLLIMFQGVALFVLARICQVNLFQPILQHKGFSLPSYGIVMAIMTIFEAIGSYRSKWLRHYLSDLYAIFIFTVFIGICFYFLSIDNFFGLDIKILTILSLCLFSFIIGLSYPIQKQLMNEAITEPRLRASILSVESIIDRAINSLVASGLAAALAAGHLLLYLKQSALVTIFSVFLITILIKFTKRVQNELPKP